MPDSEIHDALSMGRTGMSKDPSVPIRRTASGARPGQGISFATQRPRDPMFYWEQNNLPYRVDTAEGLQQVREFARVLYWSHPVVASAVDIFSKYPLGGIELSSKDPALSEFYEDLFFNDLNYEEFLSDLLRSYWTLGEAWPLGSFSETLGVWEDDELIHPDDVIVTRSPFQKEPRFSMRLPESLRNLLRTRTPVWEYEALLKAYPEVVNYQGDDAFMPVSNVLLKQIAFKGDLFHTRGIPILLRGMRAIHQEEMLNAAQDAIADRLYTPLILVRLGATAQELGTSSAWVPTEADIAEFENHLDAALAADFRVLSHHFAVKVDSVFGRESMPRFDNDFDRLTERILQVFGMSKAMLSGSTGGQQTYAAEALNRDLVSQLLTSAQRLVKRFFRQRALVVAEAQQHYDYEMRGGKRYPIFEEVLQVDPETGEKHIIEQPKLLVPDLQIKAMDLKREEEMRQFIEHAVGAGVPVSQRTRFTNLPIDLDEERDTVVSERVDNAVAEQEVRRRTYEALRDQRLPIPDDLRADFEATAQDRADGHDSGAASVPNPNGLDTLDPNGEHPSLTGPHAEPTVEALPRNKALESTRPGESDEQRSGMPRAALLDPLVVTATGEDGEVHSEAIVDEHGDPLYSPLAHGPRHIGLRAYANLDKSVPLDDD